MSSLKQTLNEIKEDLPGQQFHLLAFINNYLYNASFRVLLNYRLGKYFFSSRNFLLKKIADYYRYKLISKRGCAISYSAVIGKKLLLPHPIGVVIGDGVVIKDNVMIFQQVTLGSHGKRDADRLYPVVESNVRIYAGAKIIGGLTIGENSIIGANSLVNKSVPPNAVAYGIPCKIKES